LPETLTDRALELVTGGTAGAAGVVGVVGVAGVVGVFGVVVVVVVADELEGSSAEVPTVAAEVTVLDDDVVAGAVAEVATDAGGVELAVVADVVPALLVVVAAVVAAVLAPVAELVSAVEVPPQAVSAVITAQQEILRRGSILFRTMTPRRAARKFELCEMYSGLKNDGQHVSQRRLSRHATCVDAHKTLVFKR
jgi:hypothetical protein